MQIGKNPAPRKYPKTASHFNYPISKVIPLPEPVKSPSVSFFDIINSRKSIRKFKSLDMLQISTLLWHSAKVREVVGLKNGHILTHRPSPSAGAIHPIDIFIALPQSRQKNSIYYYNPFEHQLSELNLPKSSILKFLNHINDSLTIENATLVWLAAHSKRTKSFYKNSESLIWRDAGASLMTFQLNATALGISSCLLGTLAEPFFYNMFKSKIETELLSAGGLLLG